MALWKLMVNSMGISRGARGKKARLHKLGNEQKKQWEGGTENSFNNSILEEQEKVDTSWKETWV